MRCSLTYQSYFFLYFNYYLAKILALPSTATVYLVPVELI